jgi:hypothetical protein
MDASFKIDEIPVEASDVAASYRLTGTDVLFRLPTGGDQEEAARAVRDKDASLRRILERCILEPKDPENRDLNWDKLGEQMETVLPRVAFEIEAECPECGRTAVNTVDPVSWFVGEVSRRQPEFERQIHLLALHYHWPLRELLGLSCERRGRWARLLAHAIDRDAGASYA